VRSLDTTRSPCSADGPQAFTGTSVAVLRVVLHRFGSGVPVGRADFTVLIVELAGLHQPQRFIDVAADRLVIDVRDATRAVLVHHEGASEREALVFEMHAEKPRHEVRGVSQDRNVHLAETAFVARSLRPLEVYVLAVHGARNHCTVRFLESLGLLGELNDFRRAYEGEVAGIEEKHVVLALEVVGGQLPEGSIRQESISLPFGNGLPHMNNSLEFRRFS